jgi:predicted PhzF superfamily epimerase YddE/YHI9
VEVDLCGHATLATAHVLYSSFGRSGTLEFMTRSGTLTAEWWDEGIELDFPSEDPTEAPLSRALTFLKTPPLWTGNNRMDWFVHIESLPELLDLKPNFEEIASLGKRGLIVTAQGDDTADFVSRCFYPQSGINEDPVTGSAHCALAPFWEKRLGKSEMIGLQASSRRGWVLVKCFDNRIKIRGSSVTILEGKLKV